jgi:hypothetical protein
MQKENEKSNKGRMGETKRMKSRSGRRKKRRRRRRRKRKKSRRRKRGEDKEGLQSESGEQSSQQRTLQGKYTLRYTVAFHATHRPSPLCLPLTLCKIGEQHSKDARTDSGQIAKA